MVPQLSNSSARGDSAHQNPFCCSRSYNHSCSRDPFKPHRYDKRENQGLLHPDPSIDKLRVWATVRRSHAESRMKSLMQERQMEIVHRLMRYKAAYSQLKKRHTEVGVFLP